VPETADVVGDSAGKGEVMPELDVETKPELMFYRLAMRSVTGLG
jgi:hypothetical protein